QPEFRDMGILDATASSLRSQIDRLTAEERAKATADGREVATAAGLSLEVVQRSTDSKAHIWREQIKEVLAAARGWTGDGASRRRDGLQLSRFAPYVFRRRCKRWHHGQSARSGKRRASRAPAQGNRKAHPARQRAGGQALVGRSRQGPRSAESA